MKLMRKVHAGGVVDVSGPTVFKALPYRWQRRCLGRRIEFTNQAAYSEQEMSLSALKPS